MCKCLSKVQEQLVERNAAVTVETLINFKTGKMRPSNPSVRLHKLDNRKRSRLPTMFCSYCPFCGKKYR